MIDENQPDAKTSAGHVRSYLRKRRFPAIVKAEKEFLAYTKRLHMPKNLKMIPPKNFEGQEYALQLTFKDLDQLHAGITSLEKIAADPETRKRWGQNRTG